MNDQLIQNKARYIMNLTASGIWNIPGEKEKISGNLYMDPFHGILLILYSSEQIGLYREYEIITGKTTTGSNITLYKCEAVKLHIYKGAEKENETHIIADYLFDGITFCSENDILFHEIVFRFSNLDEWAHYKGFELYPVKNCRFSLTYSEPEETTFSVDENTTIKIFCGLKAPLITIVDKEIKVTQSVYVSVRHNKPQTLEISLVILKTLMNFVSLCIGRAVNIIRIIGFNPDHYQIIGGDKEKLFHEIPIYMAGLTDEDYVAIDPRLALLNLQTIISDFQFYMRNWYDKSELLQPVVDQYLSTYYYEKMSIEQHFLSLVQAIESYHRRTRYNYERAKDKHKERIKRIIEHAPEDYKIWLKQKLAYSNEITLKQRLDELMHDGYDYWLFVNGKKEREKFTNDIKNTRNYFTHYDESLENKALKGEDLKIACFYLKTMLEYYLLKEIGLSVDLIREKTIERLNHVRGIRSVKEYRRKLNN